MRLYIRDTSSSLSYRQLYLTQSPNQNRIPIYKFNFTEGFIYTGHSGLSRFYGRITPQISNDLNQIEEALYEVSLYYFAEEIDKSSYFTATQLPTIRMPSFMFQDLLVSLPINIRTKYHSQYTEITLDQIKDAGTFTGKIVMNIPWIRYFYSEIFEPYAVVGDLYIDE